MEYVNPVNSGSNGQRSSSSETHTPIIITQIDEEKIRNRRVIWFNPPFYILININIGKYFLNLLDRQFNRDNPLRKIFNRNTIKISYSCTNSMHSVLNNHNRRLLDKLDRNSERPNEVSCRRKGECPLGRWCDSKNVIYQVRISPMEHNSDGERVYIGISTGNRKLRLYNHRHSFSNLRLRNQTTI